MSMKTKIDQEQSCMQFKISLQYIKPLIWRRIVVPSSYTFWDLHCAIQEAMGWTNSHLHAFSVVIKEDRWRPVRIQMPNSEWDDNEAKNESEELLRKWFPKKIKQCLYTYDFGDSWDHTILFEKMVEAEVGLIYPRCEAGKNTCPPEDCGGAGGYQHLMATINTKGDIETKDRREWMGLEKGEKYDPAIFNPNEIDFSDSKQLLNEWLRDQKLYGF